MMKIIAMALLFPLLAASAASARAPLYLAPSDVLARLDQFAGQRVTIAGILHPGSDARCLSLGEGRWSGRFAISGEDASRIGASVTALAGRFVIIEGVLIVQASSLPAGEHNCSSAEIEGVTIVEATP